MGSLNMTLRTNTLLSLLSLLATVSAHPGGYWWMGQDGAFGSQSNNNQIVDNSPSPSPSPALELVPGGGYYGSSNQPTEDFSSSSSSAGSLEDLTPSPSLPVVFEEPEDLPVTECPVGWKCVSELFCDATATMVSQRVQLSKAQIAIRGNLIQCMNPATGQFNFCCRRAQAQLSPQISPSPSVSPVPDRTEVEEALRPSEASCLLSSCAPTGSPPAGVPARRMLTVSTTLSAALMAAPTSVLAEVLSLLIPDHRPTPARPLLLHLQSSPRRTLQRRFPPTWPPISWPQVLRCPPSLQ